MSDLIDIQENLIETNRALARLAREATDHAGSEAFTEIVKTVEARKEQLVRRLRRVAGSVGMAVCEYHLIPENGRLPISGLTDTLGKFQNLYTVVYDAVKMGSPKRNTAVTVAAARATELDFGYTMAGSVIVVLTVPDPQSVLFGEDTQAERAVDAIFKAVKARKAGTVLKQAKQLGSAPTRSLFSWAESHLRHGLGAEIDVYKGEKLRKSTKIHKADFQRLATVISAMSDESQDELEFIGQLVGAQTKTQTFWFEIDGYVIKGDSAGLIGIAHTVELPKMYRIKVRKTSNVRYSTEEERARYVLLNITPLSDEA